VRQAFVDLGLDTALWCHWRWQIECFSKLLKQTGHHLRLKR